jgi:DNA-binding response OmpR family regulator
MPEVILVVEDELSLRETLVYNLTQQGCQVEAVGAPSDILQFNDLIIDNTRHEVCLGDQVVAMKPKEYDLLFFMARHRGQVLSRELALERAWGWDFTGGSRTVDVHIRWLREKLETDPANPTRVVTVRGAGYRFEG